METVFQNVIKNIEKVTIKVPRKIALHVALMISTRSRKNYASMADENGIPYHKVFIKQKDTEEGISLCSQFLMEQIKIRAAKTDKAYLIIDFTMLAKAFSEKIPKVTYDYDGVTKRVSKGFSAAFVFWSDGDILIPFEFSLWLRKQDAGDLYQKKTELTKQIITIAKENGIPFSEVRLDGAFSSIGMLTFLQNQSIHFTMRIPNNRVVVTKNGKHKLSEHPDLAFKKNQKYKTIRASFKGISCYFTAHKRKAKNGTHEVVFLVSDVKRSAEEHVMAYKQRWPAERYFRSSKQHIGLCDCQSTNEQKQRLHVFHVMVAYTVLQLIRIDKKKRSVEEVLHPIRGQKLYHQILHYIDLEETFMK